MLRVDDLSVSGFRVSSIRLLVSAFRAQFWNPSNPSPAGGGSPTLEIGWSPSPPSKQVASHFDGLWVDPVWIYMVRSPSSSFCSFCISMLFFPLFLRSTGSTSLDFPRDIQGLLGPGHHGPQEAWKQQQLARYWTRQALEDEAKAMRAMRSLPPAQGAIDEGRPITL